MLDAGVEEDVAVDAVTEALVEADGVQLGCERDPDVAVLSRHGLEREHDGATGAAAAVVTEDGYAADVGVIVGGVEQQTAGGYRRAIDGHEDVARSRNAGRVAVVLVDFEGFRHALLVDEHGAADSEGLAHSVGSRNEGDFEVGHLVSLRRRFRGC